jgi:hypothetical protein
MAQCFSSALTVPFPTAGMGLSGNAAMTAWPIKSCTKNSDCATGTECGNGLGLSAELIKLDDPYDLLVYGTDHGSAAASCGSTKGTNNKGVAKVIEYFTGKTQDPTSFAFCMPKFTQPNLEEMFKQAGTYEDQPLYQLTGLASYAGVLPGITDQPNVVVSFPPADSEVPSCARLCMRVCVRHAYDNFHEHGACIYCMMNAYVHARTHTGLHLAKTDEAACRVGKFQSGGGQQG